MPRSLTSLILIIFYLIITTANAANKEYVMFIDAGSSGSRLHIFEYELSMPLPLIDEVYSESTKPGLASFSASPESAALSLKDLLDHANIFLQKNRIGPQSTQLNIFATAGMRLLAEEKQQAIYQHIRAYLEKHYLFPVGEIKTISGEMEGLFGWLDINYLLNNLQNGNATVGSIDMGGASTQIAFATSDLRALGNTISINLNHQHYNIFSKSFLGLGQDQAREAMNQTSDAASCYPANFQLDKIIVGCFNLPKCANIYKKYIDSKKVAKQLIPLKAYPFMGYSGIYYTYHFFQTDQIPQQYSLEKNILQTCMQPWEQLKTHYVDIPDKFLATYCANAVYQSQLLYRTYLLQDDQLIVAQKIQGREIDWTLGATLYALTQRNKAKNAYPN